MSDLQETVTRIHQLLDARRGMNAQPAGGVPGLWDVPGYPELTTNQLLQVWNDKTFKAYRP